MLSAQHGGLQSSERNLIHLREETKSNENAQRSITERSTAHETAFSSKIKFNLLISQVFNGMSVDDETFVCALSGLRKGTDLLFPLRIARWKITNVPWGN